MGRILDEAGGLAQRRQLWHSLLPESASPERTKVMLEQSKGNILDRAFKNAPKPRHSRADKQRHCITDVKSLDEKMLVAALRIFFRSVAIGLPRLDERKTYGKYSPPIDKTHERLNRSLPMVNPAHGQHAMSFGNKPAIQLLWPEQAIWLPTRHHLSLPLEQGLYRLGHSKLSHWICAEGR